MLENKGLVLARLDENDHRKRLISLTKKGKELALQISRLYVSLEYHKRHQIYSARIVKCKNRKDDHTSMIGKIMYYKIFGGWKIEEQGVWHYYSEDHMDDILFGEKKKMYS